jgi:hypothetical protein
MDNIIKLPVLVPNKDKTSFELFMYPVNLPDDVVQSIRDNNTFDLLYTNFDFNAFKSMISNF